MKKESGWVKDAVLLGVVAWDILDDIMAGSISSVTRCCVNWPRIQRQCPLRSPSRDIKRSTISFSTLNVPVDLISLLQGRRRLNHIYITHVTCEHGEQFEFGKYLLRYSESAPSVYYVFDCLRYGLTTRKPADSSVLGATTRISVCYSNWPRPDYVMVYYQFSTSQTNQL